MAKINVRLQAEPELEPAEFFGIDRPFTEAVLDIIGVETTDRHFVSINQREDRVRTGLGEEGFDPFLVLTLKRSVLSYRCYDRGDDGDPHNFWRFNLRHPYTRQRLLHAVVELLRRRLGPAAVPLSAEQLANVRFKERKAMP